MLHCKARQCDLVLGGVDIPDIVTCLQVIPIRRGSFKIDVGDDDMMSALSGLWKFVAGSRLMFPA